MPDLFDADLMLEALADFFPTTCTIQTATLAEDDHGQSIPVWSDLAGHIGIACSVAPSGGRKVQTGKETYVVSSHRISLAGRYLTITAAMQAVVDGITYEILLPEHSGFGLNTNLLCQVVR
ncbi:MAG: hypothetical protein WC683_07520 [bacterium]|jgi:head-tail adaptor